MSPSASSTPADDCLESRGGLAGGEGAMVVFFTINGSLSGFLTSEVCPVRQAPLFAMAATGYTHSLTLPQVIHTPYACHSLYTHLACQKVILTSCVTRYIHILTNHQALPIQNVSETTAHADRVL